MPSQPAVRFVNVGSVFPLNCLAMTLRQRNHFSPNRPPQIYLNLSLDAVSPADLAIHQPSSLVPQVPETVMRDWRLAKAWLMRELSQEGLDGA